MKDQTTLNYERRIALNDMKAKKAAADMKALYQEGQKLKRDARTHRLCNLGGLLESYLKEPELLDPDDIKVILDAVFSDARFAKALDNLLDRKRGVTKEAMNAENAMGNDQPE